MCGGHEYQGIKTYFPNPKAHLPVYLRNGEVTWVPWGWRAEMDRTFINGGWARHESILAHKWKAWNPRPVLIACDRFMEKDEQKQSHWFDVTYGMAIQGLVASRKDKQILYVVTEPPPPGLEWVHDRWPRLVYLKAERG